jgi:hypothetical protein
MKKACANIDIALLKIENATSRKLSQASEVWCFTGI